MKMTATFASDDHTSGTFVEIVPASPAVTNLAGLFTIKRITARITGNTGACRVGIYVADSGKTSLTNLEMALGEVYYNGTVAAAADPSPELNVVGTPIAFEISASESLYAFHLGDANPTTCTVDLFI
jgi:hypothetical protein